MKHPLIISLNQLLGVLFIFARLSGIFMLVPGFNSHTIPPQIKLSLALAIAVALASQMPLIEASLAPLVVTQRLAFELGIGLFLGAMVYIFFALLDVLGNIIGLQGGFSSAVMLNPSAGIQEILPAGFLSLLGTMLFFSLDLHHLLIQGLFKSFEIFAWNKPLIVGDIGQTLLRRLAESFSLAIQLATPFIIANIVIMIGLGFLNRIMPQLQVIFLAMPLQVLLALSLLALLLSALMGIYNGAFQSFLSTIAGG